MKVYIKIHKEGENILLAACDEEILGKRFLEGDFRLDVHREFYCGELQNMQQLFNMIEDVSIINLTGNNVVNSAIKRNLVSDDNVLEIDGIKHAQILVI